MKWVRLLTILLLCTLAFGCAAMRQDAIRLSKENLRNFATADKIMQDFIKVWPQISGALDGARDRLPTRMLSDKDKIDELIYGVGWRDKLSAEDDSPVPTARKLTKRTRAEIGIRFGFLVDEFAMRAYRQLAPRVAQLLTSFGL